VPEDGPDEVGGAEGERVALVELGDASGSGAHATPGDTLRDRF
jgi:hypothetical protein